MVWKQSLVLAVALVALASAAPSFSGFGKGDKALKPGFYDAAGELVGSNADANDYSVIIGEVDSDSRLLMKETVWKEGIFAVSRDKDIIYPKKHEIGQKITGIKILDQRLNGKNGKVKVKEGGIGEDFIRLHFDSQRGRDMSFVVEIYGKAADSSSSSSEEVREVVIDVPVEVPAAEVAAEEAVAEEIAEEVAAEEAAEEAAEAASSESVEEAPRELEIPVNVEPEVVAEPILSEEAIIVPEAIEPIREEPVVEALLEEPAPVAEAILEELADKPAEL